MDADEPPPFDGPHWKTVAEVYVSLCERYGILADEKFGAQSWWWRWTTAAGWPRRFTHTMYPPETKIVIVDNDALNPGYEGEAAIRINGEEACGWLAVWDPPAEMEAETEPAAAEAEAEAELEAEAEAESRREARKPRGPKRSRVWADLLIPYFDAEVGLHGPFPDLTSVCAAARARVRAHNKKLSAKAISRGIKKYHPHWFEAGA